MVVKLGGSVVTDKSTPFTYRRETVNGLMREVARSEFDVVIVHGGGSFGHPVARRYGLSTKVTNRGAKGVSRTREAMFRLNALVCSSMTAAGLNPYPFAPFNLLTWTKRLARRWISALLEAGLIPLTFGDVVPEGGGFKILSGDTIVFELCRLINPKRCIFALDAEGVYDEHRIVIPTLTIESIGRLKTGRPNDTTGGIGLKLREAARIAALGIPVSFVSGDRPIEFSKSLRGLRFHGTIIQGHT